MDGHVMVGGPAAGPALSTRMPRGPDARRLALVPLRPGPIVRLAGEETKDDLDLLVEDVFGPPTEERAGVLDVVLLVVAAALLLWALVGGASGWVVAVAIVLGILGLALPARAGLRAVRDRLDARRLRVAGRRGYLLDVTAGATADLVDAHDAVLAAAALPGSVHAGRAPEAAHLALLEVASLLHGLPPEGETQAEYVARRTRALRGLARELEAAHQRLIAAREEGVAAEAARRSRLVAAVTGAREELQAEDRRSSMAQLERLTMRLAAEVGEDEPSG